MSSALREKSTIKVEERKVSDAGEKQSVGILSLGCPRNLVDSEQILGRLSAKGHSVVEIKDADIAVLNTCAFIEDAKRESIDALLDLVALKKEGRLKKIIVYGCLAERYRDTLIKEFPEVDAFVGALSLNHESRRFAITPPHFAYLKICEGCVNACSYCVIPGIKGKLCSLDTGSVLKKVEEFNLQKISELNIIGQDITGYGIDLYGKPSLERLLKEIIKKSADIGWIRLLYLNPERLSDELLRIIAGSEQVCKYIDIPIQHINNRILKLMNRKTAKKDIIRLIEKARKMIPGVGLRTAVIVGFPSETDKEFKELLSFIREMRFERLGAFIYSREEQTPAYHFKGQLPKKIKLERFDAIMALQQKVSCQVNEKFMGKTLDVLIDEKENGAYIGRTRFDAPEVDGNVFVRSAKNLKPGDFVKVRITDTLEYDLTGEVEL